MINKSLTRIAAISGIAAGLLWTVAVVTQYSLGTSSPSSGTLFTLHELISVIAILGNIIGFLGLLWGGAVKSRFGAVAVGLYALGDVLIIVASLMALSSGSEDNLLFPIGGFLSNVGLLLTAIAVLRDRGWMGWQRYVPLLYTAYEILGIWVPIFAGVTPDGPGMAQDLGLGIFYLLIGVAVYTAPKQESPMPFTPTTP